MQVTFCLFKKVLLFLLNSLLVFSHAILFTLGFTHWPIAVYLVKLLRVFLVPPPPLLYAGKSVVSEPTDEVQETEVGRGGLGVSAEEERIASHKPVETGD